MILRELFYFNRETADMQHDDRYISDNDTSELDLDDTRKTRLTLGQINELRKASELHIKEQQAELEFISRMYATPAEAAQ
jgi:hypothetical protein